MKESTTYQAIVNQGLAEGAVNEARKLLLRLGGKKLGRPSARVQSALVKITELERLEKFIEHLSTVTSWQALLKSDA